MLLPGLSASRRRRSTRSATPSAGSQSISPIPFREFDDIRIALPEELTPEVRPAPRNARTISPRISLASPTKGRGKLHVQRDLIIKKSYFAVDQYAAIKALLRRGPGERRRADRPHQGQEIGGGV